MLEIVVVKWLMEFFLPRLLLGLLIFCLLVVTGMVQPTHAAQADIPVLELSLD